MREKAYGAYLGAAIGDAMGGPVECQHAARIKKHYGRITGLLPYQTPPGLIELHPGYALHPEPGSVTDDSYIRHDLVRFLSSVDPPWQPNELADWMLANADFSMWWPPAVQALKRVQSGEVSAEEAGASHTQGGGVGWWTPIGVLFAGDPHGAAAQARTLCRIWKAPLEQDILSAVQAGVAEGMRAEATADSVVQAVLSSCGPLAGKLLQRGVDIGRTSQELGELIDRLYANCLLQDAPTEADAALPEPEEPLDYSDERYSSVLLAEQIPLALAAFVFSEGDPAGSILNTVMIGRDCDTTATTVGSWSGALHGSSALPQSWVDQVIEANMSEMDLRSDVEALLERAEKVQPPR